VVGYYNRYDVFAFYRAADPAMASRFVDGGIRSTRKKPTRFHLTWKFERQLAAKSKIATDWTTPPNSSARRYCFSEAPKWRKSPPCIIARYLAFFRPS
jgi:hypothetical protein